MPKKIDMRKRYLHFIEQKPAIETELAQAKRDLVICRQCTNPDPEVLAMVSERYTCAMRKWVDMEGCFMFEREKSRKHEAIHNLVYSVRLR